MCGHNDDYSIDIMVRVFKVLTVWFVAKNLDERKHLARGYAMKPQGRCNAINCDGQTSLPHLVAQSKIHERVVRCDHLC